MLTPKERVIILQKLIERVKTNPSTYSYLENGEPTTWIDLSAVATVGLIEEDLYYVNFWRTDNRLEYQVDFEHTGEVKAVTTYSHYPTPDIKEAVERVDKFLLNVYMRMV